MKALLIFKTILSLVWYTANAQDAKQLLPEIVLKKNIPFKMSTPFFHSVAGKPIDERTIINLQFDDSCLQINIECMDNPWVAFNNLTEKSRTLSNQEVFEIFIGNGADAPEQYLEIQVNPNNAIFIAKISNRYKSDKRYSYERINPKEAGVIHDVTKDLVNKKWEGSIKLPLQLLKYPNEIRQDTFRLNMYRIIANKKPVSDDWICTAKNSTFACWNSTMTTAPQFHVPEKFGYLILK